MDWRSLDDCSLLRPGLHVQAGTNRSEFLTTEGTTMRTSGNTIFIPGATSGIGRGLAERFAERGDHVIVGGRRRALLDEIAQHPRIDAVEIDMSSADSIAAVSAQLQQRFPQLNVIMAMAGIMRDEDVHSDGFLADAELTVTTNLLGPIRLVAAFSDFLAGQTDPAIVTVSSGLAFTPLVVATPTYNATKAAVHVLSENWRTQLADAAIQVIELVPPAVQTDLQGDPTNPNAMPLEDFLIETMALLSSDPDATEILVERVKPLRYSVVNGTYHQMMPAASSSQ